MSKKVFEEIKNLITERRNPKTFKIDSLTTSGILKLINAEDKTVPQVVAKQIPKIAQAVELVVKTFKAGGRLFYIGAGTSGRLGVLDAAECPPTFGTDPKMIHGVIAGGFKTLIRSQEGVEDNFQAARKDLSKVKLNKKDMLVGIAASRRTPYVLAGLKYAKKIGCKTIFIYCNPNLSSKIDIKTDVEIPLIVGPEVIMGSTRMKAGTTQKLVLNMLSTTAMIRMGKVYQNMMVDLKATSQKLVERSKRTIMIVTGVDYKKASFYLKQANGNVKTALVMILAGVDKKEARRRLEKTKGFVRGALKK